MAARAYSRRWLAAATAVSAALILGAPYIGQLRTFIRTSTGTQFPALMAGVVLAVLLIAIVYAVVQIGQTPATRAARFSALLLALVIAVGYAVLFRTGNSDVDSVERFHFLEYGLITTLFYRTWRPTGDTSVLLMPILAGLLVGTLEEWFQWFIPARVGEVRDVFLNLVAIASGLLFSLSLDPRATAVTPLSTASRRRAAILAVVVLVVFGGFFQSVHLGYEIGDAEAGVFRSRYTAAELAAIGEERAARWKLHPPLTWARLSQEDQYMTEGVAHVQRRNQLWDAGNVLAARHEDLILERYYAPVLDSPSYISPTGHRWSPDQRADAEARGHGFMIYVSDALDYPVFTWPKWAFWLAIAAMSVFILRALWRPA
jgi:VanZ family protein